jgi:hypothetical protein
MFYKILPCTQTKLIMQKGLLILLFSMLCFHTKAQQIFVNGKSLNTLNVAYVTIKVQKTWMTTRFSAFLDYGQGSSDSQQEMTDAAKKALFFKSKVEIFNLLDRNGWDLIDSYEESKDSKVFILHIFRRKK